VSTLPLEPGAGSTVEIRLSLPVPAATTATAAIGLALLAPLRVADAKADAAQLWLRVSAAAPNGSRVGQLNLTNHYAPPNVATLRFAAATFEVLKGEDAVDLRVFCDRSMIEAFAMNGRGGVIAQEYRPTPASDVHVLAPMQQAAMIENLTVWSMSCGHGSMKSDDVVDDDVVCVDWCAKPLARSAAVHSLHDVSAGATGNPWHDNVYPPSAYDIVDEVNLRRKELGAPLDRLWWAAGVQWDWPANSSTPTLHADPEPTPPNFTSHRAHWDLRALDVKVLNLQMSVAFPDTTILQLQGPQAYLLADPTGVRLGEHFSRVLDWYSRGGFTDEFGRYHHSGHNISFGYLEVLNEIDINPHFAYGGPLNATRRYIKLFDGVATVVKQRHPSIKFVGNCLSGRGDSDGGSVWRTFLNMSEHAAGVPWPIDAVSYHLYTGRASDGAPFNEWPAGLVQNARNVLPSAKTVTSLIKQISPTTQVFVDEIGLFFTEPVREAMNFETMRGDGLNTSFWNLQSAIYSMWAGELAAVGVDMFGASQLLGYPAGPPGTPVGAPAGNPAAGTPFQPQVTPDGNCPVCINPCSVSPFRPLLSRPPPYCLAGIEVVALRGRVAAGNDSPRLGDRLRKRTMVDPQDAERWVGLAGKRRAALVHNLARGLCSRVCRRHRQ